MDAPTFEKENAHLKVTLDKLQSAKNVLNSSLQVLGVENLDTLKDLRENPETSGVDFLFFMEQLHEKNATFNVKDKYKRLEELESSLKEPYFARIDLADNTPSNMQAYYIGKFGYTEETPLIIDWRAKIASVYYRYRYPQKNIKYDTPKGIKIRDLTLKRTFEIDNGHLIKYYNNDIQLDESEIITEKIEQRTGGVLEDIVETIQESQLDIIEADPRQVCVVQGCVGSGKSTVAIHKLSHIFFNYPELIHPERSILIAKNQILVGYLSTLFPKLGIFDINYKTLRDLIYNLVFREELKIKIDFEKENPSLDISIDKIKNIYKELKKIHTQYEQAIGKIFSEEFESFASFVYDAEQSVLENLQEIITDLNEELVYQKSLLKERPNSPQAWLHQSNINDLRKITTKLGKLRRDLLDKTLSNLAKKAGIPLAEPLDYINTLLYVFLYAELIGFSKVPEYEYCVVDEGQDLSVLEYLVLSKFVLNGRFCILGDLNQSYQESGLTSWEDIYEVVKEAKNANTFELDTNYRSTMPIIDLANNILAPYTQRYLPKSINRKGVPVEITTSQMLTEFEENFLREIKKDAANLDKSIGIICFSKELFDLAERLLNKTAIPADKLIKLDASKPVHYIPKGVYLTMFDDCKGLEFSKVYVLGLNLGDIDTFADAKRAFVAVTRAMNELSIYTFKPINPVV